MRQVLSVSTASKLSAKCSPPSPARSLSALCTLHLVVSQWPSFGGKCRSRPAYQQKKKQNKTTRPPGARDRREKSDHESIKRDTRVRWCGDGGKLVRHSCPRLWCTHGALPITFFPPLSLSQALSLHPGVRPRIRYGAECGRQWPDGCVVDGVGSYF